MSFILIGEKATRMIGAPRAPRTPEAFSVILSDGVGRGDSERGRVVVRL